MNAPEKTAAASRLVSKRLGKIAVAAVETGEALERYAHACDRARGGLAALPGMAVALKDVQEKMQALIGLTGNLETDVQGILGG